MKKNGQRRYKCFVLGRDKSYFVKNHPDSTTKLSETDTINMLEVLTDNIFGGRIFEQSEYLYVQPCSSSRRLVPLFVRGRLHTGASQEKTKRY